MATTSSPNLPSRPTAIAANGVDETEEHTQIHHRLQQEKRDIRPLDNQSVKRFIISIVRY